MLTPEKKNEIEEKAKERKFNLLNYNTSYKAGDYGGYIAGYTEAHEQGEKDREKHALDFAKWINRNGYKPDGNYWAIKGVSPLLTEERLYEIYIQAAPIVESLIAEIEKK